MVPPVALLLHRALSSTVPFLTHLQLGLLTFSVQIPTSVLHLDGCEVSTDSSFKCPGPDSAVGFS